MKILIYIFAKSIAEFMIKLGKNILQKLPGGDSFKNIALIMLMILLPGISRADISNNDGAVWQVPKTGGEGVAVPSPTALSMQKFEDLPVSYATGTADLNIPLVDLPGGAVTVSLGLRYHTGGIKRGEKASSVGLGWTMTGLAQVSRQIHGFPDEWRGDMYDPVRQWVKEDYSNVDSLRAVIEAKLDSELDMYSFNIPGYSGHFYIINNKIEQLPATDVEIIREANTVNGGATDAFVLTAPDGTRYRCDVTETVDFQINDSPRPLPYYNRNYSNAITSWYVSKITGPQGIDTASIFYQDIGEWSEYSYQNITSDGFTYYFDSTNFPTGYDQGIYRSTFTWGEGSPSGTVLMKHKNQKLPTEIKTRCGSIWLNHCHYAGCQDPVTGVYNITLRDADENLITEIDLYSGKAFSDRRRKLSSITERKDGEITRRFTFEYNDITSAPGYDIFGYSNGSQATNAGCHSIVDTNLKLSLTRTPSDMSVMTNTLKSYTDVMGLKTELEYEPSVITIEDSGNSDILFHGDVIVGIRLRQIKSGDKHYRRFIYENPMCNINLSQFRFSDFLSYSGTHSITNTWGHRNGNLGIAHTSSLNAKGVPLENAVVYYGRVTEEISSTPDYANPIKTVYDYDLEGVKLRFRSGCAFSPSYDLIVPGTSERSMQYLGSMGSVAQVGYNERRLLGYYNPAGHIEGHLGGEPVLTCKTEFKKDWRDKSVPWKKEYRYYSTHDTKTTLIGVHAESRMFKTRGYAGTSYSLNIEEQGDMAVYPIYVKSSNTVCDSIVAVELFHLPNGVDHERRVKTEIFNSSSYLDNGIAFFKGYYTNPNLSVSSILFTPCGFRISSDGMSMANFKLNSCHAKHTAPVKQALDNGVRNMPVAEKWIYKTSSDIACIQNNNEHTILNLNGKPVVKLMQTVSAYNSSLMPHYTYIPDTISVVRYTGYDELGRLLSIERTDGSRIRYSWGGNRYDFLDSCKLIDMGLTTVYDHTPLVGCNKVQYPSGKNRRYRYRAGQLVSEYNSLGKIIKRYGCHTALQDPDNKGNYVTMGLVDSSTQCADTVFYDSYGNAVKERVTVAGGKQTLSHAEYDLLGRVIEKWLPVPVEFSVDNRKPTQAERCKAYYDDDMPYRNYIYNQNRDQRPEFIRREGMSFYGQDAHYQYACNSSSDEVLKCNRYVLGDSSTWESVTLCGLYRDGTLDVTYYTDADGHSILTFNDWRGLKVLERRVISDREYADTYYLYDILGNTRVIIQPEGVEIMNVDGMTWNTGDDVLKKYAFISRYDLHGNRTYARTPGCGAVEMRYDKYNRLCSRSTQHMRDKEHIETVTAYDAIGRVIWTGNKHLDSEAGIAVTDSSLGYDIPGCINVVSVNYYDNYEFVNRQSSTFADVTDRISESSQYGAGQLTGTLRRRLGYKPENYPSSPEKSDSVDPSMVCTVITYDVEGNETGRYSTTTLPGIMSLIEKKYSRQGYVTSMCERVGNDSIAVNTDYDVLGNPLSVAYNASVNGKQKSGCAEYHYDDLGRLSSINIGKDRRFTIDREYNIRNELTGICSVPYSESISYETGMKQMYNGNISEIIFRYKGKDNVKRCYDYDGMDRLLSVSSSDGHDTHYTYNLNSSPLTIRREDMSGKSLDNITLEYDGNQLIEAIDQVDEESGLFVESAHWPIYDSDERVVSDVARGLTAIKYHYNSRPSMIVLGSDTICYEYNAEGQKLSAQYRLWKNSSYNNGRSNYRRVYSGSFELDYSFEGEGGTIVPDWQVSQLVTRIALPWGYLDCEGREYVYITDYQGNIRTVVDEQGQAIQVNDYYPYGGILSQVDAAGNDNRYKYSGKEYEPIGGENFYDFDARIYLPSSTLFNRPDDMAADYPWLSPYTYCAANPVMYVDPTGCDVVVLNYTNGMHMAMLIQNESGKWQYYSVNGNNMYIPIIKYHTGGRIFNDVAVGLWDSPQDFLNSSYNVRNSESKEDTSVSHYDFAEGYQISSTKEQDEMMRNSFIKTSQTTYNPITNNCATAVQKALIDAGIPVSEPKVEPSVIPLATPLGLIDVANGYKIECKLNTIPSSAFKSIIEFNPDGQLLHKE
ncbi:MAG: hypothetical protein NC082_02480 [Clostridiales bacterium]|nr:hypothetical protein [Clostridiales bacterium]